MYACVKRREPRANSGAPTAALQKGPLGGVIVQVNRLPGKGNASGFTNMVGISKEARKTYKALRTYRDLFCSWFLWLSPTVMSIASDVA